MVVHTSSTPIMNELIEDINKRWNDIEALTSHKQHITITITIAITNNHPQAHDNIVRSGRVVAY